MIYNSIKKIKKSNIIIVTSAIIGSYSCFALVNKESKLKNYLELIEKDKNILGNSQNGEIQIIDSVNEILKIQEKRKQDFINKGLSLDKAEDYSKVGIVSEDPYWYWLRDAIKTDRGTGTYNRLLWKSSLNGAPGVAMLPILPNGKFLFISAYRHATRSWELELSRGGRENNENEIAAAQRELLEETGYKVKVNMEKESIQLLGKVAPDAGTIGSVIPVYFMKNLELKEKSIENTETISGNIALSCKETLSAIKSGFYEYKDETNKKKKLFVRDAFITYAILQYINNNPENNCF
ncbi:NUDIX hydrolase [Fluviispira sanaruensis]|uniref:GDP-mannose pyrophosphatase n=1 Tax=Fluviispira sanaruensis TaxID=2493639 RepID=A0A4P2VV57_FLUSA|nr:NUDIX hydrolase [Fluviispira sanaruensis]BBH53405.1 NUDIX hydrolase [Fluviispira sanaruensis]